MGGWLGRVSCHNKVGVRIISVVTMVIKYRVSQKKWCIAISNSPVVLDVQIF